MSATFRDTSILERRKWKESEKWTLSTNNALKMLGAGMLYGAGLSLIFFRSTVARAAVMGLASGFGVGSAYVDAKFIFGHDLPRIEHRVAEVVPKKYM